MASIRMILLAGLISLALLQGGLAERQPKGTGQPATATAAVAGAAAGVGPGCSYSMDKKTCDDVEGCVWCDCSLQLPARCYDESEAKFLPKEFFKCKELKPTAAAVAAEPNPGPGAGCSMAVDKKACGKEKGCLWCEGGFGPGSCYDEAQAKFLPKQFYKCKKPSTATVAMVAAS